jgi:hypothetical protein
MVLLKQNGISVDALSPSNADAWVVPEGGTAGVYVSDPGRKAELIPELRKIFSGGEGVAKVYGTEDFDEIAYPVPTASSQAPDLVLAAGPDYMFSGESEGDYATPAEGGTHGYINSDPQMRAIFVASGANIRKGVRLGNIRMLM